MRHGRPERFESGYCNVFGTWRWFRPERGWRREHAARVFQAIQALLWAHELVMSGADLAATEYERGFSDASESCLTRRAR